MQVSKTRRVALTAATVVGALTLALTSVAAPRAAAEPESETRDHAMGSQIRLHEPVKPSTGSSGRAPSGVPGIDVSGWQKEVDWAAQWRQGKRFAWVKATEGTSYKNPYFSQQYNGSFKQGFIRGAYHFALPGNSSGAAQATYFSNNGGGWSGDGKTLPGVVDLEYNPYGPTCYGMSKTQLRNWIAEFSNTYKKRWRKYPAIYTSTSWWNQCVGASFSKTNPLWVARYNSSVGALPYDWKVYTVWQYSDKPIDQNVFNGSYERLKVFAKNSD